MASLITSKSVNIFYVAYFLIAAVEIVSELFDNRPLSLFTRMALPVLLSILYYIKSKKPNALFYIIMATLVLNILFFYSKNTSLPYIETLSFMLQKILALVLVLQLLPTKNYLYFLVAAFPFLLVFFYLASVTNDVPDTEFNLLILHSVLISVLGGISVASYLQNDSRCNSWLLISTLLFIGLRFIVFIEKYFLSDFNIWIYRPIEVMLNVFAFFAFYKFLIASETIENNDYKI